MRRKNGLSIPRGRRLTVPYSTSRRRTLRRRTPGMSYTEMHCIVRTVVDRTTSTTPTCPEGCRVIHQNVRTTSCLTADDRCRVIPKHWTVGKIIVAGYAEIFGKACRLRQWTGTPHVGRDGRWLISLPEGSRVV